MNTTCIFQLESQLLESANILNGSVDTADFNSYVFQMLFLKCIANVYDKENSDSLLRGLIVPFSKLYLGNSAAKMDVLGQSYEYLITPRTRSYALNILRCISHGNLGNAYRRRSNQETKRKRLDGLCN